MNELNLDLVFLKQTFQKSGGLEKYCLLLADHFGWLLLKIAMN